MPLLYSATLLVLFFLLLIGEFFVPSAGMVGVAAAISGITSIVIAFTHSMTAGLVVTSIIGVSTPAILYAMVFYWPYSPIGKLILNRRPGQVDEPIESKIRGGAKRKDLVGKLGEAMTDLLPSGRAVIEGARLDVFSDGSVIDKGTPIVVTSVIGGKIRVRIAGPGDIDPEQTQVQRSTESIESSLESLDLDDLDD